MRLKYKALSCFPLLLSLVPFSAYSAQLEEVVVTAQKKNQNLQDVPISLDVIQVDELSAFAINTSDELALASPSLIFQDGFSASATNFVMRGIGSLAFDGGIQPSVTFVLDDAPLARTGEFLADLGDIERVEILRGPQGTLYGRNATAGAINVVRTAPTDEFEAYIEQALTDDDESITRFMVNGAFSDKVRGRFSAYYKDRDGFVKNIIPTGDDSGAEETFAVVGKVDIELSKRANLLLTADYRDSQMTTQAQVVSAESGPGGLDQLGILRTTIIGNGDFALGQAVIDDPFLGSTDSPSRQNIQNKSLVANFTYDMGDERAFKSITSYREFDNQVSVDIEVSPAAIVSNPQPLAQVFAVNTNLGKSTEDEPIISGVEQFSQEFRFEGITGNADWIAGVYLNDTTEYSILETPLIADVDADGSHDLAITDPAASEANWKGWAVFGDATFQITDSFNIFAGLRWTDEKLTVDVNRQQYILPIAPGFATLTDDQTILFDLSLIGFLPAGLGLTQNVIFKEDVSTSDWSGRLGGNWDFSDNASTYLSLSRGFVGAGAFIGRASNQTNFFIEPSTTEAIELGLKSNLFENRLMLNGALFYQEVQDLQTSHLIPGTLQSETFNAGNLDTSGVELNATFAASDLLTLDLALSYLNTKVSNLTQSCFTLQSVGEGCSIDSDGNGLPDTQDVNGNSMILAPDLSYRLGAVLDIPMGSMPFEGRFNVAYSWQDDIQYTLTYDPFTGQDSYGVLDASFALEDKEGRYSVLFYGKNLSDKSYYSQLAASTGVQGRSIGWVGRSAHRYFGVKFRYNF